MYAEVYEESRARAWEEAEALAEARGIDFNLMRVPGAGHCLYSSLQASLHGAWDAEGDLVLRRDINRHGRGMDPNTRIEEVGGRGGSQVATHGDLLQSRRMVTRRSSYSFACFGGCGYDWCS